MKKIFLLIIAIIILVCVVLIFGAKDIGQKNLNTDYKNITFSMAGNLVTLVNGVSEEKNENENATKIITRYFGNELIVDINSDGTEDVVFLITQETGGSGNFFYVVSAIKNQNGEYVGSDAYFLGDRIAPQNIEVSQNKNHKNVIVINFADRAVGEPMTAQPSVGKSVYLKLDQDNRWVVVEPDFEGEADANRMSLEMKKWIWEKTEYPDGEVIRPHKIDVFTLTFSSNSFDIGTDCNNAGGEYSKKNNEIIFTNIRSTLMYCEGSQETQFIQFLMDVKSFNFSGKGELIFDLKSGGIAVFR